MLRHFVEPQGQREQVPRHVPAVYRRDVERTQRFEGAGVVPVEEVSAIALELLHRRQRPPGPSNHIADGNVPEVVRGQIGQKRKAYVCGRGAVRDALRRIFLKVVGRQVVIRRADERFEESPGATGRGAKEERILVAKFWPRRNGRAAQPPGDQRRKGPQRYHWRDHRPCVGASDRDNHRRHHRCRREHPHRNIKPTQVCAGAPFGVAGSSPFEQLTACGEHTHQSSADRIKAQVSVVRQGSDGERVTQELPSESAGNQASVLMTWKIRRPPQQIPRCGHQSGQHNDRDDHQRVEQRAAREEPTEEQQHQHRDRNEAPPQVVQDLPSRQR